MEITAIAGSKASVAHSGMLEIMLYVRLHASTQGPVYHTVLMILLFCFDDEHI